MSDLEHENHGAHGVEFEREDLSTRAVFGFMIGLAVTGIVIYFIINGMYSYLDKYERSQAATASPLMTRQQAEDVRSRKIDYAPGQDYVSEKFSGNGAPMLEIDEKGQFHDFLMKQEQQLNSYGWIDEKAGVAHIPIERAMQLVAQRGFPVKPQGGAQGSAAPSANAGYAASQKKQ